MAEKIRSSDNSRSFMYGLDSGIEFETLTDDSYEICNLIKVVEERYQASLVFELYGWQDSLNNCPKDSIGMQYIVVDDLNEEVEFLEEVNLYINSSGSNSDGFGWASKGIEGAKEISLTAGAGSGLEGEAFENELPEGFKVEIYWDGVLVETMNVTKVEAAEMIVSPYPGFSGNISRSSVYMNAEEKVSFKEVKKNRNAELFRR